MRGIKFRAWGWDTRYPEYEKKNYLMEVIAINWETNMISVPYKGGDKQRDDPMDEFVIEQFTGLKDKNGRDIYEGDIVEWDWLHSKVQAPVSWDERRARFYASDRTENLLTSVEVIGNIHEHGELLK